MNEQIKKLPMVALRGMTIMPKEVVHFDVSREMSLEAIQKAMAEEQQIFLLTQRSIETEKVTKDDLYEMGVIASIKQIVKMPKKILRVLVEGEQRAKLNELVQAEPYLEAEITVLEEYPYVEEEPVRQEAMLRTLQELFLQYAVKNPKLTKEIVEQIAGIDDLKRLVDEVCANVPFRYEDTQKLLEETDALNRYFLLTEKLEKEIQVSQIKDELQEKVKARVDKHQKEYLLREELRVIQEELGDDSTLSDADEFAKAVKS